VSRSLRLVGVATTTLTLGGILLFLADPFSQATARPAAAVPSLISLAALIVVVLVSGWAPTLAWVAIVVGSISASAAVTTVMDAGIDRHATPAAVVQAALVAALLVPPASAAAYAVLGPHRPPIIATAWLIVASLTVELAYRAIARSSGTELTGGLPRWAWLVFIAGLTGLGLVRDLAPVLRRTRRRLAGDRSGAPPGGAEPGTATAIVASGALPALRVLVDELVPGRDVGRAEAIESERGRLAADLHAQVLPSLHRALAQAEAGGSVERLATDLRTAVDDVESLLVARRSIVLEEMGLLAGLEWLAERIEDRSDVRVEIEVLGTTDAGDAAGTTPAPAGAGTTPRRRGSAVHTGDDAADGVAAGGRNAGRPPRDVERAAFRIAQLALDNVLRHAPGHRALVRVAISPTVVEMRIEDDGDGPMIDEAAAARDGRRGIADMRSEAAGCGGMLEVGRARTSAGMTVAFRWPARGRRSG
jgi:signal transduction histidine kinase